MPGGSWSARGHHVVRAGHGGPSRKALRRSRPLLARRELVLSIPAPGGDHREHEASALAEQLLVSVRIALADLFGHVGEVELDRPTTTRLEVDEQRPVARAQHVARVRLAVQELLDGGPAPMARPASQRAAEKLPVGVLERWTVSGCSTISCASATRSV